MSNKLVLREKQELETRIKEIDSALRDIGAKQGKNADLAFNLICLGVALLGLGLAVILDLHVRRLWQLLVLILGSFAFLVPPCVLLSRLSRAQIHTLSLVYERIRATKHLEELRKPERLAARIEQIDTEEEKLKKERTKVVQEIEKQRGTPYRD